MEWEIGEIHIQYATCRSINGSIINFNPKISLQNTAVLVDIPETPLSINLGGIIMSVGCVPGLLRIII